ncbi:MAG: hypothetical protein H7070_15050 [Saprospiraceae bacterium]|nr:hypothetical protein [Pyrinomonadaceae bacterium]
MSKAENTYWGDSQTASNKDRRSLNPRNRSTTAADRPGSRSQWVAIGVAISLTVMLILTINFRASSVLSTEAVENTVLTNKIRAVTSENLALQEEIHYLKKDSDTIEREAKKFGLTRPKKEKVPVPAK